jgi:uncharacterized protein
VNLDLLSAFVIGLLGSGHCVVMCGGISSMLTTAIDQNGSKKYLQVTGYHLGRILSYSLFGAIVGFTGSMAIKGFGLPLDALQIVAGIFLILLGLYIGQWFMGLTKIEAIGKYLWRFISPYTKKLIPVRNTRQALALGVLWGWLPCGLIYSTLSWSLASGSTVNGALIMLFFGLGTLPAMMTASLGILNIKPLLVNNIFRNTVALLLISYGSYTLSVATGLMI